MPTHRHLLKSLLAAALLASLGAGAQTFPSKPITVIVPFAPGGGVDSTARLITPKLAEQLKTPVVIENVAGAAGTIGTQKAVRSPADGYTLLFAVASPINVAPLVAPSAVRYDALKELAPLATVASGPFVLIGKPALPAANTAELIRLIRAQPGKLNFGTDGVGTSLHVTAEMIKQRAGNLDIVHVPYKSGPQVLTDVAGGQVDLGVLPLTLALPFIKEGKVKAFGVTSKARWPGVDVPALAETADLKEFEIESWLGFLAPAGLPPAIAAQITRAIDAATKDPEVVRKLGDIANRPLLITGPQFGEYLARERQLIGAAVGKAGIKAE